MSKPDFIQSLEFVTLESGEIVWSLTECKGGISAWRLRQIADELDLRNQPFIEHLRKVLHEPKTP